MIEVSPDLREALKGFFLPSEFYELPTTYTPSYYGSTSAGTTTYSANFPVGTYTRLGNVIIATGTVIWTAATGTGDARISLPFTSASTTNQFFSGSVRTSDVTFANSAPQVVISPGTDYFIMQSPLSNTPSTTVAIEAAGNIIFTVVYFV